MEITKELKQDLSELESACSSFLGKYESQLTDALNKTKMSAEDSLKIDLMLELVTHLSSAQFVSSYMQKDIVKEGILLQDAARKLHARRRSSSDDERYRSVCPR